ncbi:hypothetical protein [Mycolicibacterium senegalense]|uniref:hypothetical protein n=1 Tax=Mycolicibacterium senegalense TaxID=1796 RepID=UPI00103F610F|nr:hypothetical protein [Mycolicibacterium senegalense]
MTAAANRAASAGRSASSISPAGSSICGSLLTRITGAYCTPGTTGTPHSTVGDATDDVVPM